MPSRVSEDFRRDMRAGFIEKCGKEIEDYFTNLGLPYIVHVWNGNPNESGNVYRFRVTLTDADGTTIVVSTHRYVSSTYHPEVDAEQVQSLMEGAKQHYVFVVTPDKSAADRLCRELFARDDVIAAETGNVDDAKRLLNSGSPGTLYERGSIIDCESRARVKPTEQARRGVAKQVDIHQR